MFVRGFKRLLFLAVAMLAISTAQAFNTPLIQGHLDSSSIPNFDPSTHGFWLLYNTTRGLKMQSRYEVLPVHFNSKGDFEIPALKFGWKEFKFQSHKKDKHQGLIGNSKTSYPGPKKVRLLLVKNSELREGNRSKVLLQFFEDDMDFLDPNHLSTLGWLDIQMDQCEETDTCGPEFFEQAMENLRIFPLSLSLKPINDRVSRLLEGLSPDSPSIHLNLTTHLTKMFISDYQKDALLYYFATEENPRVLLSGWVNFRVDRSRLDHVIHVPSNLPPYEYYVSPHQSHRGICSHVQRDSTAFQWKLHIPDKLVEVSPDFHEIDLHLKLTYPFTRMDLSQGD